MIIKERGIPIHVEKLRVLLRRVSVDHPQRKQIEEDLRIREAGYRGEKQLDYFLQFLNEKKYFILNDLCIHLGQHFFQMDTLLITSNFLLIIDAKNLSGEINFDPTFKQIIQISTNKEAKGYSDPSAQLLRQRYLLSKWLADKKIQGLPIEYFVAFTNSSSILRTDADKSGLYDRFVRVEQLVEAIQTVEARFKAADHVLTDKQLLKISKQLMNDHQPPTPDILQQYSILKKELFTGVQCPECSRFSMHRLRGRWQCKACLALSVDGHIQALRDYFLLWKDMITNQECREYLNLSSSKFANRLLNSMNLKTCGSTKGRFYQMSEKS